MLYRTWIAIKELDSCPFKRSKRLFLYLCAPMPQLANVEHTCKTIEPPTSISKNMLNIFLKVMISHQLEQKYDLDVKPFKIYLNNLVSNPTQSEAARFC